MGVSFEEVPCNICGGKKSRIFLKIEGYSYQKCQNCGLIYQSPRPVFDELRKRYGDNYFDYELKNHDNFFNLMKLGLKDIGFDYFFDVSKAELRFLDIGCATGQLLHYMKNRGWATEGVEICRASAEYAIINFGLDIHIGTLESAYFPDNFFDVIHFSHLIEHVPDPRGMLKEVKRLLKSDGHVILTTPNIDGWQARFSKINWRSAIPEHIYLFSKKTLNILLESSGFRVLRQLSWGGVPLGKRPNFIKKPLDRLAKFLNIGDVMLFHCKLQN